jgi:predicted AlkP superfamily phosphohydrolase/phosphomutase
MPRKGGIAALQSVPPTICADCYLSLWHGRPARLGLVSFMDETAMPPLPRTIQSVPPTFCMFSYLSQAAGIPTDWRCMAETAMPRKGGIAALQSVPPTICADCYLSLWHGRPTGEGLHGRDGRARGLHYAIFISRTATPIEEGIPCRKGL